MTMPVGGSCTHVADDAIVILEVFAKKTEPTPKPVVEACRKRLAAYLKIAKGARHAR